jgi:hypothetical protein
MWHWIFHFLFVAAKAFFYVLPALVAYVVTAVGLAILFMEELQIKLRAHRAARWMLAIALFLIGIGAVYSDKVQKAQEQAHIDQKIQEEHLEIIERYKQYRQDYLQQTNTKGLTPSDVETIENIIKKYSKSSDVPPVTNSELRREVSDYTTHLRTIEDFRDQGWRNLFPITHGGLTAPLYNREEHRQQWLDFEKGIEDDFTKNDLGKGISLRDELRKRLKESGTPTPMNALLGGFPAPTRDADPPDSGRPFTQLANYLDELSRRLPYP